ncbi:MAG: hypothetical protein ACR2LI_07155 [Propionibacteriaceae bacterium]
MPDVDVRSVRGWEVVRLSTDAITVDVVPGLGGTITSLRRRRDDLELLWQSPWGLRPPYDRGGGDARTQRWAADPGGLKSIFPNAGDPTTVHGTEWGEDGETWLSPFDYEVGDDGSLIMSSRLVQAPFEVRKVISLRADTLSLAESIRNVGGAAMETVWGAQLVLGAPILADDATFDCAANLVHPDPEIVSDASYSDITPWPRSQGQAGMINLHTLVGPDAQERRLVYLDELDAGRLSVENRGQQVRMELDWDLEAWPYVIYELESAGSSGFPFFDKGYFLRVQPSSSWPAKGLYDARRISTSTIWFDPDQQRSSHLDLRVHDLAP